MSWWKYKPLFLKKWKQPRAVSRTQARVESRDGKWRRLATAGVVFLAMMGTFLLGGRQPNRSWWFAASVAVVVAGIVVYLPFLANQFAPRRIGIGEKAVVLLLPQGASGWRYADMSEIRFVQELVAGERHSLMVLLFTHSPSVALGVASDVDVSEVVEIIKSQGFARVTVA